MKENHVYLLQVRDETLYVELPEMLHSLADKIEQMPAHNTKKDTKNQYLRDKARNLTSSLLHVMADTVEKAGEDDELALLLFELLNEVVTDKQESNHDGHDWHHGVSTNERRPVFREIYNCISATYWTPSQEPKGRACNVLGMELLIKWTDVAGAFMGNDGFPLPTDTKRMRNLINTISQKVQKLWKTLYNERYVKTLQMCP